MSLTAEGPGWWLASDGRWYPPQSAEGPDNQTEKAADQLRLATRVLLIAGVATMFGGLLLPWMTISFVSFMGINTDTGKVFLIVTLVAAAMALVDLFTPPNHIAAGAAVVVGLLAVGIAGFEIADVASKGSDLFFLETSVGGGLYVSLAGALAFSIGGVLAWLCASREVTRPPTYYKASR